MMTNNNTKLSNYHSTEDSRKFLAKVYAFILSWPDPDEKQTAGSGNFGEDTEPAAADAPNEEEHIHDS